MNKIILIFIIILLLAAGFFVWNKTQKDTIDLNENIISQKEAEEKCMGVEVLKDNFNKNCIVASGTSMEPFLSNGQFMLIDKNNINIQRKDIILLKSPENIYLIRRVIGLPGEKISISNGKVFTNDSALNESEYLGTGLKVEEKSDILLGSDEYFVMGDNRQMSRDSRNWGPIKKEAIAGKFIKKIEVEK